MSKNVEIPLKSLNFNSFRRLRLNFHEIPWFHLCSLLIVVVAMHHTFVLHIYIYIYILIKCILVPRMSHSDAEALLLCAQAQQVLLTAGGKQMMTTAALPAWQLHDSTTNISSWRNSPHITWTPHGHHMPWRRRNLPAVGATSLRQSSPCQKVCPRLKLGLQSKRCQEMSRVNSELKNVKDVKESIRSRWKLYGVVASCWLLKQKISRLQKGIRLEVPACLGMYRSRFGKCECQDQIGEDTGSPMLIMLDTIEFVRSHKRYWNASCRLCPIWGKLIHRKRTVTSAIFKMRLTLIIPDPVRLYNDNIYDNTTAHRQQTDSTQTAHSNFSGCQATLARSPEDDPILEDRHRDTLR